MKKIILLILAGAGLATWWGCKKSNVACALEPVEILRYDCDRIIFRFLNNNDLGDASWTNIFNSSTYNHVSSATLNCSYGQLLSGQPDTVYLKVRPVAELARYSDCVQCQAISANQPESKMEILDLSLQNDCDSGN